MQESGKPRLVGVNHVALEVGDVQAALSFYGAIFDFELRGQSRDDNGKLTMAFVDMGDQFLALSSGRRQPPDDHRHFGLVVDDRTRVENLARDAGAEMVDGPFLDFRDPWGNRIEVEGGTSLIGWFGVVLVVAAVAAFIVGKVGAWWHHA